MESVKLKQEDVSKVLTDVRCLKGRQDGLTNKLDLLKRLLFCSQYLLSYD